ncbi:transmembrane protein 215 [Protobothrops mucrosquamatus]|uniref:transmembrane protein 215 n=1 Tax=Protobothrops mucrosquamatus TaxID=103944 RepID=UPI000775F56B|nr:transmembrane protein 215 [Protobothrops mucrosquamatus]
MRPDDINPRTGLVVALVSVFLVFGFMFTVSGIKGETLGDIPLLAIGPAICLPGIAAIALTRKTDGCTKWPNVSYCPPCACCCRKKPQDKEVLELLRTPSDLESGKSSCDELALKACDGQPAKANPEGACGGKESLAAPAARDCVGLAPKVAQEEMLRYLEKCYPEMPGGNIFVAEASPYSALEQLRRESLILEGAAAAATWPAEDDLSIVPSDSVIVCTYTESSPYDRYCCYINPAEDLTSDPQAIV